jgi:hypothetical protein
MIMKDCELSDVSSVDGALRVDPELKPKQRNHIMKQVILIAMAAVMGSVVAAIAAQQTDGVVRSVNVQDGTLELQSGENFTFKNGTVLYGLAPGDRVGVAHEGTIGIGAYDPHPATQDDIDIE